MNIFAHTPNTPAQDAALFAVLFPNGYTAPAADPLEHMPRLTIEHLSPLDQDLWDAASTVAYRGVRGRRSVPRAHCDNLRSDEYQTAAADTAFGGYSVAECLVSTEPVVAALVVEIFARAAQCHHLPPATLKAQVEMQLVAVDAARKLQRYVPTAEQVQLRATKQTSLFN